MLPIGEFPESAVLALAACRNAGVVLDFVPVLGAAQAGQDEEHLHRWAAISAVSELCQRIVTQLGQGELRALSDSADAIIAMRADDAAVAAATRPGQLDGRRLSLREFYGPLFDPSTRTLLRDRHLLPAPAVQAEPGAADGEASATDRQDRATAGEASDPVARGQETSIWDDFVRIPDWGFADAFTHPPYPLMDRALGRRLDEAEVRGLFLGAVDQVLRTPAGDTPSWCWKGDWSGYFRSGREWWGAVAWTIRVSPAEIVTVAASTTD